ncbi:MAG: ABC transporter permease [Chloroflexota bacterium]|nr:MAG: ABC transporter permease [Chloroflexota bacterium]
MLRKIVTNFWLRTLIKKILIIWMVVTLTFLIIRALPGNPVEIFVLSLMDTGLSEDEARMRAASLLRIDLDAPLSEQYGDFLSNLLRGDLGDSYILARGKPVMELVMARLPWTLFSVGTSLMISFVIGMFLGMQAAYKRNSWFDHLLTNLAAAIDSVPNTLTAIILILLLGITWKLVPLTFMRGSLSPGIKPGFTLPFVIDLFKHFAIPGTVYVLTTLGSWLLAMRSSTMGTLGDDYVTVARARGLTDLRIITSYVGRNASLPLVTNLAISLGFAVGGSILIESIFVYQGVGLLLSQAINKRDYPIMQGILLVTTITVILSTALADLLYGWLDPRIRVSNGGEE